MTKSISDLLGAKVHYNTEVFTCKKNIALGATAFIGLTSLVIGVLASVHILSIPAGGMYALTIGGGAILLGDGIALTILTVKYHNAKKPKEACLKALELYDTEWWTMFIKDTVQAKPISDLSYTTFSVPGDRFGYPQVQMEIFLVKKGKQYSLHLFNNDQDENGLCTKMENNLDDKNYAFKDWDEEKVNNRCNDQAAKNYRTKTRFTNPYRHFNKQ